MRSVRCKSCRYYLPKPEGWEKLVDGDASWFRFHGICDESTVRDEHSNIIKEPWFVHGNQHSPVCHRPKDQE